MKLQIFSPIILFDVIFTIELSLGYVVNWKKVDKIVYNLSFT